MSRREAAPGSSGDRFNMEDTQNGHAADELLGIRKLIPRDYEGVRRQNLQKAAVDAQQSEAVWVEGKCSRSLWESKLGALRSVSAKLAYMPTEKGMNILDTDASVVAVSGILHQEQQWNGRTVLRPIAYGN